jgi:hypothetical protein
VPHASESERVQLVLFVDDLSEADFVLPAASNPLAKAIAAVRLKKKPLAYREYPRTTDPSNGVPPRHSPRAGSIRRCHRRRMCTALVTAAQALVGCRSADFTVRQVGHVFLNARPR